MMAPSEADPGLRSGAQALSHARVPDAPLLVASSALSVALRKIVDRRILVGYSRRVRSAPNEGMSWDAQGQITG